MENKLWPKVIVGLVGLGMGWYVCQKYIIPVLLPEKITSSSIGVGTESGVHIPSISFDPKLRASLEKGPLTVLEKTYGPGARDIRLVLENSDDERRVVFARNTDDPPLDFPYDYRTFVLGDRVRLAEMGGRGGESVLMRVKREK